MSIGARRLSALAVFVCVVVCSVPLFVHAEGMAADMQCIPVIPVCGCGQIMGPKGCTGGPNKFMCPCVDTTNGFSTTGQCLADQKCHAMGTSDSKGPDTGLSQLGQMLGQLMGQLMKGGGGGGDSGGGGSPFTPPLSTGCTGSYYQTSDVSKLSDPCAQYSASPTTVTTSTTCDTLSSLLGTCNTNGNFSASPLSGPPPLTVGFTAATGTVVDPGDGGSPIILSNKTGSYTYNISGMYTATLKDASSTSLGTITLTVTPYVANPAGGDTSVTAVLSGAGTSSTNALGLGAPLLLAPGLHSGSSGDILFSDNGVTIFGSSLSMMNNTGVAGFFGSNTFNGQQPQSLAAQLCQARPWSAGFFGAILPATFFDGLCTSRGYQVGTPPAPTAPVVQLRQVPPAQKPAAATTTPAAQTLVQIWAVPASVPLNTRTSVFWNTKGVTQCTETSPDGSFNESSLSGGAATVPLTGATTFTISCLDADGKTVTGHVTVDLSI